MLLPRRSFFVLAAMFAASCDGCQVNPAPSISPRYAPLHPEDNVAVTFSVRADDSHGIANVRLYVFEYEMYVDAAGMRSARQRQGGTWGLVQEWTYAANPNSVNEQHTVTGGFPAESFITFQLRATDARGATASQEWSFAAGAWPYGNSPIPVWGNGPPGERIDVAFVSDRTDYANARAMLPALEGLIFDGYHTNNAVRRGMGMWQFYYSPEQGFISDYDAGSPYTLDIPTSVSTSTIIDHAAVIHSSTKRDWASGGNFGTEPQNVGTAVHESGHAAFDLADEYAGGGHFTSTDPYHNNYDSEAACQTYNSQRGWPQSDCENIEGTWWRPEPATLQCIMLDDQDANMPEFARSCMLRAIWYYLELGTGGTP